MLERVFAGGNEKMNYMKQVAEMLGVELYEYFRYESTLTGISKIELRFTENYLEGYSSDVNAWFNVKFETMCNLLNGEYKVVKIPKPILDDVEKKYLSKVIRPFRDRIVYISKENVENSNKEYIYIGLWGTDKSTLPPFERETMYKGMIVGKRYHLKELGL